MGLLVVVSVSVPIWTKVDFLHATLNVCPFSAPLLLALLCRDPALAA